MFVVVVVFFYFIYRKDLLLLPPPPPAMFLPFSLPLTPSPNTAFDGSFMN
jgi:hypothetical protein